MVYVDYIPGGLPLLILNLNNDQISQVESQMSLKSYLLLYLQSIPRFKSIDLLSSHFLFFPHGGSQQKKKKAIYLAKS